MEAEQQRTAVNDDDAALTLTVGKIVQVEARTWPGINKPGGVGRITQLHYSEDGNKVTSVDVRYTVVGGRERHVPIEHVEAAPEFDAVNGPGDGSAQPGGQQRNQLRDRSGLLGRCKRCGSLRADCGSCDWIEQERLAEQARNQPEQDAGTNAQQSRRTTKSRTRKSRSQIAEEESLSSSSEDEEQIRADNLRWRRYLRQRSYWLHAFDDSASSSDEEKLHEESSSDSDDPLLARLAELTRSRREHKRNLARKYSKVAKKWRRKRPQKTGLSSLETLNDSPRAPSRVKTTTASSAADPLNVDDSPSPVISPKAQPPIDLENEVEDVGDPDISSEDSLPAAPEDPSEEAHAEDNGGEDVQTDSPQVVNLPDLNLDLEGLGFIQPEGEAAAEHLPSDIVDRTQSIPFKQLPSFFDDLLKELSNERIPDSEVAISEFQLKTRAARKRNDNDALQRLKEVG